MSRKVVRAARRVIESFVSRFLTTNVSTSATSFVLHAAEDSKTLIRTKGAFNFINDDASANTSFGWVLAIEPRGVSVVSVGLTALLDQSAPIQEIARGSGVIGFLDKVLSQINFDTKSMRKMKPGDELVFTIIAGNANALDFTGTLRDWFKE